MQINGNDLINLKNRYIIPSKLITDVCVETEKKNARIHKTALLWASKIPSIENEILLDLEDSDNERFLGPKFLRGGCEQYQ